MVLQPRGLAFCIFFSISFVLCMNCKLDVDAQRVVLDILFKLNWQILDLSICASFMWVDFPIDV